MKFIFTIILLLAFLKPASACNLSSVQLDSFKINVGSVDLYFSILIGAGRTGAITGADGPTNDFAVGFYSSTSLTINSFSPTTTTSAIPSITYNVIDVGAVAGAPFNTQATLYAFDPAFTTPYACITTTGACGNVHTKKVSFAVNLDAIPDSIYLFGIEGAGNPVAGCFPNPDMHLNLTSLLPLQWGHFYVKHINHETILSWSTLSETNTNYFLIQKSYDAESFWPIGIVQAAGNSNTKINYSYTDTEHAHDNPDNRTPYYRIVQYDLDGGSSISEVRTFHTHSPTISVPIVFPNPANEALYIRYASELPTNVVLIDIMGNQTPIGTISASGYLTVDTSKFPSGVYIVQIQNEKGSFNKKILID